MSVGSIESSMRGHDRIIEQWEQIDAFGDTYTTGFCTAYTAVHNLMPWHCERVYFRYKLNS